MAYWQNGELGQANSELMEALKVSQGLPVALQALSRLSLSQGKASDAQIYAQELVQKFPAEPEDRQLLGRGADATRTSAAGRGTFRHCKTVGAE